MGLRRDALLPATELIQRIRAIAMSAQPEWSRNSGDERVADRATSSLGGSSSASISVIPMMPDCSHGRSAALGDRRR
jgi:hypothetical protein